MKCTALALVSSALLQGMASSPSDLLNLQRPLTPAEMEVVVGAIRQALAGRTLRIRDQRQPERHVLMGPAGMPQLIRDNVTVETIGGVTIAGVTSANIAGRVPILSLPDRFQRVIEYTGLSARRCGGAAAAGEMIIEYLLKSGTQVWTATARDSRPFEIAMRPLEMLRTPASLTTGQTRIIGNRTARAIVSAAPVSNSGAPVVTGDPAPNPADFMPVQSLWIDTSSMLPLRWEVSQRQAIIGGYDFIDEQFELYRPAGVHAPTCIG